MDIFTHCEGLERIFFRGDAPVFCEDTFTNVQADAHYPGDNATWDGAACQDYGGVIVWIPSSE